MPLPENATKELLSRGFLRLVASQSGFICAVGDLDFGVDLTLRQVELLETNGSLKYRQTGFAIDVQLKATCEREVTVKGAVLSYQLAADNYNDLVRRVRGRNAIPLVLALFVLPDNPAEWLSYTESAMTLRRCGYVWQPEASAEVTTNTRTKSVEIPAANRIDAATFLALSADYLA